MLHHGNLKLKYLNDYISVYRLALYWNCDLTHLFYLPFINRNHHFMILENKELLLEDGVYVVFKI